MKRKLLSLLIFSACFSLVNAQTWGGEGARWTYSYSNFAYLGFSEIAFEKDTIVSDLNVQKFNRRIKYRHQVLGFIQEFQPTPIFMNENQGVVFLLTGNEFDTLYNFNAQVGEKWGLKRISADQEIITEVLETGLREINGQSLKWQLVNHFYSNYPQNSYRDTLVEHIGSIQHYLLPWDYFAAGLDGHEGGMFRCYEDIRFGSYRNPDFDLPCNFVTSTDEVNKEYHIQISPNPFTDIIKITLDNNLPKDSEILVQTVTGHTLKRFKIPPNAGHLDIPLAELPQGFYLLSIIKLGKILYAAKIVKI